MPKPSPKAARSRTPRLSVRTATNPPPTTEHTGPNVLTVRIDAPVGKGWEQWVLLSSDRHHDNVHCNQDLEREHLDEAKARNAGIIDGGDLFCAMQGKYDKRSDLSALRPEHKRGNYLDALVDTAADFYQPYAKNLWVIGRGNHETSVYDRHGTDLTERLVAVLNRATGSTIQAGGYTGWVRFMFTFYGAQRCSRTLWYAHGWGGGGPVTINTIQAANRMPMMVEGADVIFTGHVHEAWQAEKMRVCLSHEGKVTQKSIQIVQGATYKDEYQDGRGGWHVQTGKPPKPVGAWWLRFSFEGCKLQTEIRRAG